MTGLAGLRTIRRQWGLSQDDLARKAQVTQSSICRAEIGSLNAKAAAALAVKLATVLKCTVEELTKPWGEIG